MNRLDFGSMLIQMSYFVGCFAYSIEIYVRVFLFVLKCFALILNRFLYCNHTWKLVAVYLQLCHILALFTASSRELVTNLNACLSFAWICSTYWASLSAMSTCISSENRSSGILMVLPVIRKIGECLVIARVALLYATASVFKCLFHSCDRLEDMRVCRFEICLSDIQSVWGSYAAVRLRWMYRTRYTSSSSSL